MNNLDTKSRTKDQYRGSIISPEEKNKLFKEADQSQYDHNSYNSRDHRTYIRRQPGIQNRKIDVSKDISYLLDSIFYPFTYTR